MMSSSSPQDRTASRQRARGRSLTRALVAAGVAFACAPVSSPAARISEPGTILYGRVADRLGAREFLVTSGKLTWTLRTTGPGARDVQLTAQLQSLGGGRYSYRLEIPHQLLAYDLTVNASSVALSSAGGRLEHLGVTLDGRPLVVNPAAVEGLALDASRRASAVRVDLDFASSSADADGDGAPDWWEDQQGLDKYDPADAFPPSTDPRTSSGDGAAGAAASARTFVEWRAAWFPGATQNLDVFAQEDPDADGLSNLVEYAFDLNPLTAGDATRALPHAIVSQGRGGIAYRPRAAATDLSFQVETSRDLIQWENGSEAVTEVASGDSGTTTLVEKPDLTEPTHRFFRIRISRH